jgi:diketogulonate reductase-like aldo/keto reductase
MIDTAHVYGGGKTESHVGAAVAGMNHLPFLATKVWRAFHGYQATTKCLAQSLKRLRVTQADIVVSESARELTDTNALHFLLRLLTKRKLSGGVSPMLSVSVRRVWTEAIVAKQMRLASVVSQTHVLLSIWLA